MESDSKQVEAAQTTLSWARQASSEAEKIDRLLNLWHDEAKSGRQALRSWLWSGIAFGIVSFVGSFSIPGTNARLPFLTDMASLFFTVTFGVFALMPRRPLTEIQKAILGEIGNLRDPQAIGPLLEALDVNGELRATMVLTVSRLMEQSPRSEVATTLSEHCDRLYTLLDHRMAVAQPELVMTTLRLLPLMAETGAGSRHRQALVCVARYIWWSAPTLNERCVRAAAYEVLPALLERVDLGGPAMLAYWVRRLPLQMQEMNDTAQWEAVLLPHLALMQILPQCPPEIFLRLSSYDRHRLYTNLRMFSLPRLKSDYALVVLDIVRRSIDVEAMSVVQDLIDGPHASPYPQVRAAAHECVPILNQQIEKERVSKVLLRGASAPEPAPDTLLRAASGNATVDPQLLLRANVKESICEPAAATNSTASSVRPVTVGETERDATLYRSGEPS
jgi:hypothetical protein